MNQQGNGKTKKIKSVLKDHLQKKKKTLYNKGFKR